MAGGWYYAIGRHPVGPFSLEDLKEFLRGTEQWTEVLIRHENDTDWQKAGTVSALNVMVRKRPVVALPPPPIARGPRAINNYWHRVLFRLWVVVTCSWIGLAGFSNWLHWPWIERSACIYELGGRVWDPHPQCVHPFSRTAIGAQLLGRIFQTADGYQFALNAPQLKSYQTDPSGYSNDINDAIKHVDLSNIDWFSYMIRSFAAMAAVPLFVAMSFWSLLWVRAGYHSPGPTPPTGWRALRRQFASALHRIFCQIGYKQCTGSILAIAIVTVGSWWFLLHLPSVARHRAEVQRQAKLETLRVQIAKSTSFIELSNIGRDAPELRPEIFARQVQLPQLKLTNDERRDFGAELDARGDSVPMRISELPTAWPGEEAAPEASVTLGGVGKKWSAPPIRESVPLKSPNNGETIAAPGLRQSTNGEIISSNFVTIKLPRGVQVQIPKGWWLLGSDQLRLIATVVEATMDRSGVTVPDGDDQTITLLAANSLPTTTYASVRIKSSRPASFTRADLVALTPSDLAQMLREQKRGLETALLFQGLRLLDLLNVRQDRLAGYPALVMEYRRTGPRGPVWVQLTTIFTERHDITVNLAYREAEATIWKAIIAKVRQSITIKPWP